MNSHKLISTGKRLSIAVIILGLIHNLATFSPIIQNGLAPLSVENFNAMLYMSLVCGTSLILSGLLLYIQLGKVNKNPEFIISVRILGIFLALTGLLSIFFMFSNPFAWIALILNVSIFIVVFRIKMVLIRSEE